MHRLNQNVETLQNQESFAISINTHANAVPKSGALKKSRRVAPPALTTQLIGASSNESETAVVELAAIHAAVSSVAGVAYGVRVGETTTIAVV